MNIDSFKYLLSEIFFIDLKEEHGAFKKNVEYPVLIKDMRNIVKENKEDIVSNENDNDNEVSNEETNS